MIEERVTAMEDEKKEMVAGIDVSKAADWMCGWKPAVCNGMRTARRESGRW